MTATIDAPPEARPTTPPSGLRPERDRATGVHRTVLALVACALGTIPLKQLFTDTAWLLEVWVTMLIVIGPAILLRRTRNPEPWHVWPGLVLLVPWLTVYFVPTHAWLHFVPTPGAWHDVQHLLTDLHHTTADKVAPIHSTKAVSLVLCAMLGLLAALVDLIAVVGRRGALAGVPLLVVFTVAGAVPRKTVSWPLFIVGAIGFLLLLALDAEDDLRDWGKRIPRPGHARAPQRLGVSAQRVGVLSVIAAIAIPLLLPAHSGNLLADLFHPGRGPGGGFGTGGGSIDPFVALKGQLVRARPQALFSVHLTQRDENTIPFYGRVNVLTDYTGDGWKRGPSGVEDPLESTTFQTSPVTPVLNGKVFRANITISGLGGNPPLFSRPTAVSGVAAKTRWSETEQLLVGDDVSGGQKITEEWVQPTPSVQELNAASGATDPEMQQMLTLPSAMPLYVTQLVQRLTQGLTSPYLKTRAIFDYFTDPKNGFTYSLRTKTGDSGSDLVDFLKGKEGFCQQYAAALGVMLRMAGVPSRIVLGYTHPAPNKDNNFVVTTDDAHSWVEAYFQGVGWVPFDATPLSGIDGGAASDLVWAPHPHQTTSSTDPGNIKPRNTSSANVGPVTSRSGTGNVAAHTGGDATTGGLIFVIVFFSALALAFVPAVVRELRRRRRILAATHRGDPDPLWAELADTAVDLGYVWSPARTPRQVASWLRSDAASAAGSLDTLATAVEDARFGPPQPARSVRGLSGDLAAVLRQLRLKRSGNTRLMSRLWPASLRIGKRLPGRRR